MSYGVTEPFSSHADHLLVSFLNMESKLRNGILVDCWAGWSRGSQFGLLSPIRMEQTQEIRPSPMMRGTISHPSKLYKPLFSQAKLVFEVSLNDQQVIYSL